MTNDPVYKFFAKSKDPIPDVGYESPDSYDKYTDDDGYDDESSCEIHKKNYVILPMHRNSESILINGELLKLIIGSMKRIPRRV